MEQCDVCDLINFSFLTPEVVNSLQPTSLYRDDALTISSNANGHRLDRLRNDNTHALSRFELKITIETELNVANILNITLLDLNSGTYRSHPRPNDLICYVKTVFCHPSMMFRNLITISVNEFRTYHRININLMRPLPLTMKP